jgi:Pyruvate/2-oxoacid:ferredoxin oxidoreductase delta subunit
MQADVYPKLAEHLDRLPGGFGPSETDADLRLLARLFTPQEAALATHLTLDQQEARAIAKRAGLPPEEAAQRLEEMALKGLIFSVQAEDGTTRYQAVPWIVGIYEFQVNRLSEGFLRDTAEYWQTMKPRESVETTSQMRTIPVGESITPHLEAMPYEQVDALVDAHDRFAVAPCICRRQATLAEHGCDAPEESCLMFGDFADYYVRTGRGRRIDRAEVQAILARADEANLVLQPTNSQKIEAICTCCGCCCGILGGLKRHPKPAEAVTNDFRARLDAELCLGCFACLDRCPMEALSEDGDRVALDSDRCIGCGLHAARDNVPERGADAGAQGRGNAARVASDVAGHVADDRSGAGRGEAISGSVTAVARMREGKEQASVSA